MEAYGQPSARYAWLMVLIGFTLTGMSFGGFGSIGVFLKPLAAEFGWSRGEVSLGYTMVGFATFMGTVWGHLADRFGVRPFAILGTLGMVVSLLLLGRQGVLWQLYILYFLFGALGHSVLGGPLYATVGFWFNRNKGLAIGLMASGGAIGQATVPYVASVIIAADGWRAAYTMLGIGYAVIGLPLALLVRDPPSRSRAARAAGSAADDAHPFPVPPVETTAWICVAVIFCCICMAVPIVHVVPLVSDIGVDSETAAGVLTVLMLFGGLGRILGGKLADIMGSLRAYMFVSFGQTALVLWFPFIVSTDGSMTGVYVFAAAFGLIYSGVMTSILVCVREMIPARMNARSMGFVSFFAMIGMGAGGYQGGLMFDLSGAYFWSYANAAIAGVVNLTILSAFYMRIRGRAAVAQAA
jgi:MFS family permease